MKNGKNGYILWDVDTQNDFFDSKFTYQGRTYDPKLGVPEAGSIRPNLQKLIHYAITKPGWRVMGTVDAHTEADKKHLSKWPKHCMKDTPGQLKIEETRLEDTIFIGMEDLSERLLEKYVVEDKGAVYFEKHERPQDTDPDACNSAAVNPNVAKALKKINPKLITVTGVALGYCVKEAVNYFLDLGYKVALVTDAIKEFSPDELTLYADWKNHGAILVHTRDVLAGKLEELVK